MQNLQIRNYIRKECTTIPAIASIEVAEAALLNSREEIIYLLDGNDRLAGLVTDYDLLKYNWLGLCKSHSVERLMSPISIALTCEDSFETLIQILSQHIHRKIPVIDGQMLLGTIDRLSVLQAISEQTTSDQSGIEKPHSFIPAPKLARTGNFSESAESTTCHNRLDQKNSVFPSQD